jgi:TPR repeat protein
VEDLAAAARRYKLAADSGDVSSQVKYGDCLQDGVGVPCDMVNASEYFRMAADSGDSDGQWRYGVWLDHGFGISIDSVKAAEYFKRSADQGNAQGQFHYGECLDKGRGIEADAKRAAEYFKLSADQGNADGQYAYGCCLESGRGVCQNAARADEYFELAMRHGTIAVLVKVAARNNSRPPKPLGVISLSEVMRQWETATSFGCTEFLGYRASRIANVSGLVPIALREMQVAFAHIGRCLICRTLTKFRDDVLAVIEDVNGDAQIISLQYMLNEYPTDASDIGTVLLVKEPSVKYYHNSVSFIDVESPSDVVVVDDSNSELLSGTPFCQPSSLMFGQLLALSKTCLKERKYRKSLEYCDLALRIVPGHPIVQLKKCKVFMELKYYREAYENAKSALVGSRRDRFLKLLGDAAYKMRKWSLAIEHFRELVEVPWFRNHAARELARSEARMRESQTGEYDIGKMATLANAAILKRTYISLDVADYVGPIRIADTPGKGKGLIATRDIRRGTLILAEKAFAIGYEEGGCSHHMNYFSNIIRALQRNPERTSEFYSLYGGPDIDRNELIPDGIIDIHRIHMICNMNSFGWSDNELFVPLGSDYCELIPRASGMAIMASFANHSCFYNVERLMFGDVIMFVCWRDIGRGEEITISYNRDTWDNRWSITIGARQSLHHWFAKCHCRLCELMTSSPRSGRIQEILALADVPIGCEEDFVKQVRLYEELTEIYRDYPAKPFLDQFGLMIGNEYFERKEFERAVAY